MTTKSSLSNRVIVSVSIFCGIVITLLTGLVQIKTLVGATKYGWPIPWLTRLVLAPQYNPWRIDFLTLTLNVLGLSIGFYVVLYSVLRELKK